MMESTTFGVTSQSLDEYNVTSSPMECSRKLLGNSGFLTFQITIILVMAVVCIVGNSMVIFVMTRDRKLSSPMNKFIVSLAGSDLLHGCSYALYNVSHVNVESIHETLGE